LQAALRRALVLNFDPILKSRRGRRLHQVLGGNDPQRLAQDYAGDLAKCSAGHGRYEVVEWLDVDRFPAKTDGYRYDADEFLENWRQKQGWHQPDQADYGALLEEFDLLRRVDRDEIDEVWLFGPPYAGFWESVMVGPQAIWCNAPPLVREDVGRRFVIMGFNYERGVGEMLEAFGHRVESILRHLWRQQRGRNNLWEQFILYDAVAPGRANCGSMHYAPNSMTDYDWGNKTPVPSNCDDWLNFPDFQGIVREVDCREWGNGDQRAHHIWWLEHLPHAAGETRGITNNWWAYAVAGFAGEAEAAVPGLPEDVEALLALLDENAPPGGLRRLLGGQRRERAEQRAAIARKLGEVGGEAAVPALAGLLQDPEAEPRYAAVEALAEIGSPAAHDALMDLAADLTMDEKVGPGDEFVGLVGQALERIRAEHPGVEASIEQEGTDREEEGRIIAGRYELLEEVGRGGMATTYRAHDRLQDRPVALRMVTDLPDGRRYLRALEQEARVATSLSHPNLATVYDYGTVDGVPFLASELVGRGETLGRWLVEQRPAPVGGALPILAQVAAALDYLHGQAPPIVCGDLKPSNVLLEDNNGGLRAVLSDFVPLRAVRASAGPGTILGTPAYRAPEGAAGVAADLYSLGVIAYQMLAGRLPFTASGVELRAAVAAQPPPSPQEFVPELGDEVSAVLLKALAKDPEARYASAGAFVAALEEAARGRGPAGAESARVERDEVERILRGQPTQRVPFSQYVVNIGAVQGGVVYAAPAGEEPEIRPRPEPPRILPRRVAGFLDRREELSLVREALARGAVVNLHGADGVGKTALIGEIMHTQVAGAYPDGMVYLSGRRLTLEDLLQDLFETFYQTSGPVKMTGDQVRQYMGGKRALVVVDDADELAEREAEDLAAMLPSCALLIASRAPQIQEGVQIALEGLPPGDAVALFERHWGRPAEPERDTVEGICAALEGVPLAIIRAARTAAARGMPLEQLLAQVQRAAGEEPLAKAFDVLASLLSAEERQTMGALASLGGGTISADWLVVITDLPADKLADSLARLEKMHLVVAEGDRYRVEEGLRPYIQAAWVDEEMMARAAEEARAAAAGGRQPTVGPAALPGEFFDLEISVRRSGALGEAEVGLRSLVGGTEARMRLDREAPELWRRMEALQEGRGPAAMFEALGRRLFDQFFAGELRLYWRRHLDQARAQGAGVRISFLVDDPELAALPWELMHNGEGFLALRRDVTFVRQIPSPVPEQPPEVSGPLRILAASANPIDMVPLDLDAIRRALEEGLRDLLASGRAAVTWLEHATAAELRRTVREGYQVVHFEGHGGFEPESQGGYLVLEDEGGRSVLLDAENAASLIKGAMPRLVVLNVGYSAARGRGAEVQSLAEALGGSGVPAVVAMQWPLRDVDAMAFYRGFYTALGAGLGLDVAVAEGRRAIELEAGPDEESAAWWAAPVLVSRTPVPAFRPLPAWLARLSPEAGEAVRYAEAFRRAAGLDKVTTPHLLAGLYRESEGITRQLLTLFDGEATVAARVEAWANWPTRTELPLGEVEPLPAGPLPELVLSPNAERALDQALALADERGSTEIDARVLLAGVLAVPEGLAGQQVAELLQVEREALYRLVAGAAEEGLPLLAIWWASDRRPTVLTGHKGAVSGLAFGLDGWLLTSGGEDGTVRTWHLLRGMATGEAMQLDSPVRGIATIPGGAQRIVATADGGLMALGLDGDTTTLTAADEGEIGEGGGAPAMAVSPEGEWLAMAWPGGALNARNLSTGEEVVFVQNLPGRLMALAASPGGSYVATAASGGTVSVWAAAGGTEMFQLRGHRGEIHALAFSPDGRRLVSASEDRTVRVWDLGTGEELFLLGGHDGPVRAVAVTLDGRWAVSGSDDGALRVWDLESGRPLISQEDHGGGITALAVSPDGRGLASGDAVGNIRLWDLAAVAASLPQPMEREEALTRIELVMGDLLEQPVDALVNPTGPTLTYTGGIGGQLAERLGDAYVKELHEQPDLEPGQVFVSRATSLPARYVLQTPIEPVPDTATVATIGKGVKAALGKAETLHDVRALALPSIGTGFGGLGAEQVAPGILEAVQDHLREGSRLERVVFAFQDDPGYRAYAAAYRALGGRLQPPAWLPRLSTSSRTALAWAEALRAAVKAEAVSSLHLLWGLYQKPGGAARALLAALDEAQVSAALARAAGVPADVGEPSDASDEALAQAELAPDVRQALETAADLARDARFVRERQVLAGLLAVRDSEAAGWLAEAVGLPAEQLYGLVAVPGEEEPEVPLAEAVQEAMEAAADLAGAIPVAGRPCFVRLRASSTDLAEGTPFEITLEVTEEEAPGSEPLLVPESVMELTVYVNTSGFQPEVELPVTLSLPLAPEPPAGSLSLRLTPTREGEREVQVLVEPGKVEGARPVPLTERVWVARAARLPDIPELVERQAIPDPKPEVILYVALAPGGEGLQIYASVPALGRLRFTEMPALDLSPRDVTALRQAAIQAAVEADDAPPPDALAGLRAVGAALFDRLMPEGHPLRELYWQHLYALSEMSERVPGWLIISDEEALLPWEMVCPYVPGGDDGAWYDRFLGEKFVLAHWVGRKGQRMAGEAPLGKLGLVHYGQRPAEEVQRWQASLGGAEVVGIEEKAGHLAPAGPESPRYGLHILRYAEAGDEAGLVTAAGTELEQEQEQEGQGELLLKQGRLDFTLRRPVVGLSLVTDGSGGRRPEGPEAERDKRLEATWLLSLASRDNRLEATWLLPLLAARASAVIGARWPVDPGADRLFYQAFYGQMRAGAPLGWAAWYARQQVRVAYPHRADWLAYAYFGHPWCFPYLVRPGRGYTIFEQVDQAKDATLRAGQTYHFRASYRSEAPAWYTGRLRVQEAPLEGEDLCVVVVPLTGVQPAKYALEQVPGGEDYQHTLELTMPNEATTMTVMVRFQRGEEEIRTMLVEMEVEE
jgi:O-acetyl-ADP-ribose deacetylase (regulator of RNase III)